MHKPLIYYRIKEQITHIGAGWEQLAPDEKNAIEFAHKHLNEDPLPKIDEHHYSMEYVLAHHAETINKVYREDRQPENGSEITEMLFTYTTDTDLVLYRGVYDLVYELMKANAKGQECDLYEKGFLCTSLVKGHESKYNRKLRIFIPKGTNVVYQGNVNNEQNRYEVDVQRGAKLNIISADETYLSCILIGHISKR